MPEKIVEIELPNGSTALARVKSVEGVGATKTAAAPRLKFDEFGGTLEGIAETIWNSLQKVSPDKVVVELGLELAAKNGKLSGLLVEGEGKGSLTVTLEWSSAK